MVFGFGRKKVPETAAPPQARAKSKGKPPVELNMLEVYCYAYLVAEARAWPRDALNEVAWRILWLEQRDLPGLFALAAEVQTYGAEPIDARGRMCPIILGALLPDDFNHLVARDPSRAHAIDGPTHGVLILPKVAQYAALIEEPVRVSWLIGDDDTVAAETVVSGDDVATGGDPVAMLTNSGVAFALHKEPFPGTPQPLSDFAHVPADTVAFLDDYIGEAALTLMRRVTGLLINDEALIALFQAQTKGERSAFLQIGAEPRDPESGTAASLAVDRDSTNGELCERLAVQGWFELEGDTNPDLSKYVAIYHPTPEGDLALPMMMGAIGQFEEPDRWTR